MYAEDHQLYAPGETHGTVESRLKTQGTKRRLGIKTTFYLLILRSSSP